MDFFIYVLPMIFIQGINSATLESEAGFSSLQAFCMLTKFNLLAELVIEFFIFLYELYKLHNLERHSINMVVRYSETDRRKIFATQYACFSLIWMLTIVIGAAIGLFLVSKQTCLQS